MFNRFPRYQNWKQNSRISPEHLCDDWQRALLVYKVFHLI